VSPESEIVHEPSWDYNDLFLFIFLAMLAIGAEQLLTYFVIRAFSLAKAGRALALMPSQVLLYALLFGALYLVLKLQYGRPFLASLAWVAFPFPAGAIVLSGLLLAVLNGGAAVLLHTPEVDTPIKHLFDNRVTAIEFGLIGTTLGPLCEELVFRGFMQPVFVRSLGAPFGILVTAMFFGALHLAQNSFAWQSGLLITMAGIAFGWMRQLSGSTRASTIMHSAYNFTYFLAAFSLPGNLANK
jgi:membrane protease YdiL (CAAX protease family)